MTFCEEPFILKVLLILKTLFTVAKIVIPLLLIFLITIDFIKVLNSGEDSSKAIQISIRRYIAALLVFLAPTIVNAIFKAINIDTGILLCFNNSNSEYIKNIEAYKKEQNRKSEEEAVKKYEEQVKEIEMKQEEEMQKQGDQIDEPIESTKPKIVITNPEEISSKYPLKPYKKNKNVKLGYFKDSKGFSYWIYFPDEITTNLPVILFLPGYGSPQGNDYSTNSSAAIGYGPITDVIKHGYSYDAIVIHLQISKNDTVYGYISSYVKLVKRINEIYKVDMNRISVMGISHGCYGIGQFIMDYPNYLSAAVPMGCNLETFETKHNKLNKFTSTPIWAMSGKGDGSGSKQMSLFVKNLNAIGGNAKYTYCDGYPHNLLNNKGKSVLRDNKYNVIEWMLSQKRN